VTVVAAVVHNYDLGFQVRKSPFFQPFSYYKRLFYQDRLGTNIRKTHTKDRVLPGSNSSSSQPHGHPGRTRGWGQGSAG
jgi:hypothetical protein